ncbi:MAG: hypothetical protein LUC43_05990 [Burkholderiales bacterium]|nr:hypothetical protein [Burkholderiales bacterium]
MLENLPMTLTVLIIGVVVVIAFWYWLRIKSRQAEEAKAEVHHIDREPIMLSPSERAMVSPSSSQAYEPNVSGYQDETLTTKPEQENQEVEPVSVPEAAEQPKTSTEAQYQQNDHQAPAPQVVETHNPYSELMERLPFNEAMRFEDTAKTGVPSHNPVLEEVFTVTFKSAVTGTQLLKELKDIKKIDLGGHYSIYAWETTEGKWEVPDPIGSYTAVIIIVRLASASGAISPTAVSQLIQFKQRLEMMLDGVSDVMDDQQIQAKALNLSNWVQLFNKTFLLYLLLPAAITTQEFEKKAAGLGFNRINSTTYEKLGTLMQSKDGKRYEHRRGELVLCQITDEVLKLELRVPLVPPERDPLKILMMAANAFAAVFGAQIVCQDGTEINGQLLAATKKDTDKFYANMRVQGLEPGGDDVFLLLS